MTIPPGDPTPTLTEPVPPVPSSASAGQGIRLSRATLWRGAIVLAAIVLVIAGVSSARTLAGAHEQGTVAAAYEKRVSDDLRKATQDLTVTTPTPTPTPTPLDSPYTDEERGRAAPTPEETLHEGDSNLVLVTKSLHREMRIAQMPYDRYVKSVVEKPAGTVTVTMAQGVSVSENVAYKVLASLLKLDVTVFTTTLDRVIVQNHDGTVRGEAGVTS